MTKTLLIIEDEALLGTELQRHFRRNGWRVLLTDSLDAARRELFDKGLTPIIVLSDMSLPDGNALDLLEESARDATGAEWIFLTGFGTVADSVRALRLGAYDFLEKPVELDRLDLVVNSAARSATAQRRLRDQLSAGSRRFTPDSFVGHSDAARQLREMLGRLAKAPFSALILNGETGTGKGVAARIMHHSGTRQDAPLVEVNCSALPKDLLESELFGHEAGAFTGARGRRRGRLEQADGGTLFLDEIGDMQLDLQAKLLKALEEQCFRRVGGEHEIRVDVQVITATNRNLQTCIDEGRFREDLYHRLSVFELRLPALRERIEDLDELVPLLITEFNAKAGKRVNRIGRVVWQRLRAHDWPGNVRELRNVIERCVLFADDGDLPLQWLHLQPTPSPTDGPATSDAALSSGQTPYIQVPLDGSMGLEEMDRFIICQALERNQHNVAATARMLNTTRDTLRYRIQKYAITLPEDT